MNNLAVDRTGLFWEVFKRLEQEEVEYVILHGYAQLPAVVESDVDYAVRERDWARARAVQRQVAEENGWVVAQDIPYEPCASGMLLIDPDQPAAWLKLDACTHFTRSGCLYLRDDQLLKNRRQERGFWVPAPGAEFAFVLARVFAKRQRLTDYLPRLRQLREQDPDKAQELFQHLFGTANGRADEWLERPAADWERLRAGLSARHRYGIRYRWRELTRRWERIRHPVGLRLALLGPDGVGKSTLITNLQALVQPLFRQVRIVHFRPHWGRAGGPPALTPHCAPPRARLLGWAKLGYYFADHATGWLCHEVPDLIQNRCVVYDRNFDDLLVDPTRYRIRGARQLIRCLARLLPAPALTVILDAPAALVRARKPELTEDELVHQRGRLRALAAGRSGAVMISAVEQPAEVTRAVAREIVIYLAARLRHRRQRTGSVRTVSASDHWQALFASAAGPVSQTTLPCLSLRILRHRGRPLLGVPDRADLAARAFTLYPAQSRLARAMVWGMRQVCRWGMLSPLTTETARLTTDSTWVRFLGEMAGIGRTPALAILFGNNRLAGRRFTLLLFDRTGDPVTIVKAGLTPAARALIAHEQQQLATTPAGAQGRATVRGVFEDERIRAIALPFVPGRGLQHATAAELGKFLGDWIDADRWVTLAETVPGHRLQSLQAGLQVYRRLERALAGRRFHPVRWHGDFAPWNIRVDQRDGHWMALDWERGEREGPPGWDWFHFVVQQSILVQRQAPREVVRELDELLASAPFQSYAERTGIVGVERLLALGYLLYVTEWIRPTESMDSTREMLRILVAQWLID